MNLNFNFTAKTLLSDWWTIVRDNFRSVQSEFNSHVSEFNTAKQNLQSQITDEVSARKSADDALRQSITSEANTRSSADSALGKRIDGETSERQSADDTLDGRVSAVESKAHTHQNKSILDDISRERVNMWDSKSEPGVTRSEFDKFAEYVENLVYNVNYHFNLLWTAIGVKIYDGGIFGTEQTDASLDGGLFEDTEFTALDCGGFEPYVIQSGGIGAVVDGGTY